MTDDRDINALRHYVARLEDDLAKAETDLEKAWGYSSKQAVDIVTLGQEVGRLREALERLIAACDAGRHFERGCGGMTIEAQLARTVINGVRASAVEDARAALAEQEKTNG